MATEQKTYVTTPGPVTPVVKEKAVVKDGAAPEVRVSIEGLNAVPVGAMAIEDVEPGFSPTKGSPKENDPTQLANPNNPLSAVTVPGNPSNPANMPQTQSDKPASEQRAFMALNPPPPLAGDELAAQEARKTQLADLFTKIGARLAAHSHRESSIPANDEYWGLVAQHRALANP